MFMWCHGPMAQEDPLTRANKHARKCRPSTGHTFGLVYPESEKEHNQGEEFRGIPDMIPALVAAHPCPARFVDASFWSSDCAVGCGFGGGSARRSMDKALGFDGL